MTSTTNSSEASTSNQGPQPPPPHQFEKPPPYVQSSHPLSHSIGSQGEIRSRGNSTIIRHIIDHLAKLNR